MMRSDEKREMRGGDASMARTKAGAKAGQAKAEAEDRSEESGEHTKVSSGRGIGSKSVEAEHVFGDTESVEVKGAEGVTDDASAKGNRREAYEPERERDEKAAIRSGKVSHTGTIGSGEEGEAHGDHLMGHGFRETVAKNTI